MLLAPPVQKAEYLLQITTVCGSKHEAQSGVAKTL